MTHIFYEVDIQNDFMNEDNGRLYVPGAEAIKPAISKLVTIAKEHGITRVRSGDHHWGYEDEFAENGGPFPYHCMTPLFQHRNKDGSFGADFIPELHVPAGTHTIPQTTYHVDKQLGRYEDVEVSEEEVRAAIARGMVDFTIQKQSYDVFNNPNAQTLLQALGVEEAVVYGVATDFCVKAAVLGMQERGIQTYVVTDAISAITEEGEAQAIKAMTQAGAKLTTLDDVIAMVEGGWK